MRILIIGIQGMLGYNLYKYLTSNRYNILELFEIIENG